jgi:hypothetical protein
LNKIRAVIFWEREKWGSVIIMTVMEITTFYLWLQLIRLRFKDWNSGNQICISYVFFAWLPRNWSKVAKKKKLCNQQCTYVYGVGCANNRMGKKTVLFHQANKAINEESN